jgi:hypothetical protein
VGKRRAESFADIVAQVKAQPAPPPAPVGRAGYHGTFWADPDGIAYFLVDATLDPPDALALAADGARVVFDACGCGGGPGCPLDWLSAADVRGLAAAKTLPAMPPSRKRERRAELEHWRSDAGQGLVVAAIEVSWGDRIRG